MALDMKKKIKIVFAGVLFCVLFVGCGKLLRYMLTDDTASYTRIAFHEMYQQDNIDVLFVGSSHCYRSFIPDILDQQLGKNTFNLGTSSQYLDGSFMAIQEAARYHEIEHIYLELYYNVSFSVNKQRTELTPVYIISDYLKPSVEKLRYMLNASTKDYYANSFILARRNWTKLFDADYVKDLLIKKQTDSYKNYEYDYVTGKNEWYDGKGYVANRLAVEDWNYFTKLETEHIDLSAVSDDWRKTLDDIISFCRRKNISLTLVTAPMSNFMLCNYTNYDEYVQMVQDIVAGTDVKYYDFNLCREEYFPNASELFKDHDHLNCYGAEKFSYLFADFVNGKITEQELFYPSFEEKMKEIEPGAFGIAFRDREDDIRECRVVSNRKQGMEYRITLKPAKGKKRLIQDFSENRLFSITPDDHGVCTVQYRLKSHPDKVHKIKISY